MRPSLTDRLQVLPAKDRGEIHNLLHSAEAMPALLRQNLDELWLEFHDLADPNFVREFAKAPNDRAWEILLGVALRRSGFTLAAPKPGPDFLTHDCEGSVWIEAVVTQSGAGPDQAASPCGSERLPPGELSSPLAHWRA